MTFAKCILNLTLYCTPVHAVTYMLDSFCSAVFIFTTKRNAHQIYVNV